MEHGERPFWNESMETMSRADIRRFQDAALPERVEKARRESPLYRALWEASGCDRGAFNGLDDLQRLPFVVKDMVRDFRRASHDPFGGIAGPVDVGSIISRSTGTSGEPTFFVTSPADVERAGDQVASFLWQMGHRARTVALIPGGTGTRVDAPMLRGHQLIGAMPILGDLANVDVFVSQLEYLKPQAIVLVSGALDRIDEVAARRGLDLEDLMRSVTCITYGGRRLTARERQRISMKLEAEVFEIGGLGDIGFWGSDCGAHDGTHVREDYFVVETVDPNSGKPIPNGRPGELVFTSLWEDSMNYVRWRTEDVGIVNTGECDCGRTTARVRVLGRVSEMVDLGGRAVFPGDIETALMDVFVKEPVFQLVKSRDDGRLVGLNVALEHGVSLSEVARVLTDVLELDVPIRPTSEESIRASSPGEYKYRQVVHE